MRFRFVSLFLLNTTSAEGQASLDDDIYFRRLRLRLRCGTDFEFAFSSGNVGDTRSMGQAYGHVLTVVENEFVRVQAVDDVAEAGKHVDFVQLRQMRLPEEYAMNVKHIGVLFCIDSNRDGVFSYDDLRGFVDWCNDVLPPDIGDGDVVATLQGTCLLRLWSVCRAAPDGDDVFVDWVLMLLERTYPKHVWRPQSPADSTTVDTTNSSGTDNDETADEVRIDDVSGSAIFGDTMLDDAPPLAPVGSGPVLPQGKHRYGSACTALTYDLLQLGSVYGLSYATFVDMLHAAGGTTAVLDESTTPVHSPQSLDDSSVRRTSFDVPEGDEEPPGDPETNWVGEPALRAFVAAFVESLWVTLDRLGLSMLTDPDQH